MMRIIRSAAVTVNEQQSMREGIHRLMTGVPIAPLKPHVSRVRYIPLIIGAILVVALVSGSILMTLSLKEKRDKIRRDDLFTLRNAIELYKFNHRKHHAPPDSEFPVFAGSLIPTFLENLPVDPGRLSYYYVRDPRNAELYTLAGSDEIRGKEATFRFGIGSLPVDPAGVDGEQTSEPVRGIEFGFRMSQIK